MNKEISSIIEVINELLEDTTVPKNVKIKLNQIISALEEDTELSLKLNKALDYLDEISDDSNLQPYTRTQIWNIASMLESMC